MQRRKQDEKIHLDASGGGRQFEKTRTRGIGNRSDIGDGRLPGGVGIDRARMIRPETHGKEGAMNPEIRKMKVEKYGSFLFCPDKRVLCFGTYTPDGSCKYENCLLEDPAYIKKQKEIDERIRENDRREREERRREAQEPPAPARHQRKSTADMLREQIERKERFARTLYRENKPRKGDRIMHEVMTLQAKLRKLDEKGCKYL